ncbi:MAG: hypothetical protein MR562_00400 [Clostridiaceae bacterium]|nr:hypothetical protein [Clostridiaceae bacterium]
MKNITKWFKKSMHLSLALLVIAVLGIGLTVAFFTDTEGALNRVTVGEINITTGEDVSGLTKSNIDVTSNGTSEAYVRMRVDIPTITYTYINEAGVPTEGQAKITDLNNNVITAAQWAQLTSIKAIVVRADGTKDDKVTWDKESDGFWYLSTTLKQGDKAKILAEITYPGLWNENTGKLVSPLPAGLTEDMLTIVITSEAVQTMDGVTTAQAAFQKVDG